MLKIIKFAAALLAACLPARAAFAAWKLNMPRGATELSHDIYGLHMLTLWVCVAIGIAVFAVIIYSVVKFRHSQSSVPAKFSHSTKAEIIWTLIPCAILIALAIPAAATLVKIEDTRDSALSVKVTGYQWKWHYEYLDQGIDFFSTLARSSNAARQLNSGIDPASVENYLLEVDNPLVVPVGAKVRLLLTAADVIHAWWMPEFGMKKDAIPGFVNELWFRADAIGIYRGQCAELCGRDHGFMPVVVDVRSQQDYESWLQSQQPRAIETTANAEMPPE
ncbi:cytochrome c oxidase subunit II [Steroidobacter denitrificans]|uniref:Cytochrome c oxidase subunit 2 n=1 Tax=Steroidobacter denitrificans TaxID=465721 RepID=A0A127FDK4_STEDE|nr:cytochrome c oxidase subunit II [Steroidobacter denitrificans]AMN48443.1 cytochrome c oxidase subunit II [Steroidobacter denitrificans]